MSATTAAEFYPKGKKKLGWAWALGEVCLARRLMGFTSQAKLPVGRRPGWRRPSPSTRSSSASVEILFLFVAK